jgi:hypothetical protein
MRGREWQLPTVGAMVRLVVGVKGSMQVA